MPKQNSALLLNKYIWLIDTIYSARHISREDIDRRWCRSLLSEGEMCIPPRTFHRWRIAIEELFQISIAYDKWRGYYIEDRDDIKHEPMRKWLLNTFAVNNLINEGEHLRKHIAFEEIPSGQRFLTTILESIRDRKVLRVSHKGFGSQQEEETKEAYSVFSYFVVPTYELRQEILSRGANVEVVYPMTLRDQIKAEIAEMHKLYK